MSCRQARVFLSNFPRRTPLPDPEMMPSAQSPSQQSLPSTQLSQLQQLSQTTQCPSLSSTDNSFLQYQQLGLADNESSKCRTSKAKATRKVLRNTGKEYCNTKGKTVPAKTFMFQNCSCRNDCKKLDYAMRHDIHNQFWNNGDWNIQTNFIIQHVSALPMTRRVKGSNFKRTVTNQYKLNGMTVCSKVFQSTLGITQSRVLYCLNRNKGKSIANPDMRGKYNRENSLKDEKCKKTREFLDNFPKYQSHYSNSSRLYFHPELNKTKLFNLYKSEVQDSLNEKQFRKLLNNYNIRFYIPKTDTCQKCDKLKMKISSTNVAEEKNKWLEELRDHHERANEARKVLQHISDEATGEGKTLFFTFDLEKTQPLPYLNTSVVFYKRELWLYNFGIHTTQDKKGYMCIWLENEAGRGSNEICSCIHEFLDSTNLTGIEEIHTISDGCMGQNKNKFVISFMMWVCDNKNIKAWQHTYLESGHSFLPNDRDFGKIEQKKKQQLQIYSKEQYYTLISEAQPKRPLKIIEMNGSFKDVKNLANNRKFPNIDSDDNKFQWTEIKWLKVKQQSDLVEFKYTNKKDAASRFVTFGIRRGQTAANHLMPLSGAHKISKEKYKDLQELLPYIPETVHSFYKNLPH